MRDLAPAKGGVYGQIISHPNDYNDRDAVGTSFLTCLEAATWTG